MSILVLVCTYMCIHIYNIYMYIYIHRRVCIYTHEFIHMWMEHGRAILAIIEAQDAGTMGPCMSHEGTREKPGPILQTPFKKLVGRRGAHRQSHRPLGSFLKLAWPKRYPHVVDTARCRYIGARTVRGIAETTGLRDEPSCNYPPLYYPPLKFPRDSVYLRLIKSIPEGW